MSGCAFISGPCADGTQAGKRCGDTEVTKVRGQARCARHAPHDWSERDAADLAHAVEVAGVEVADEPILVRSDVWPRAEGHCDWKLSVPDTDFLAEGRGTDTADCYRQMDAQLRAWYPDEEFPDEGPFLVSRIVP